MNYDEINKNSAAYGHYHCAFTATLAALHTLASLPRDTTESLDAKTCIQYKAALQRLATLGESLYGRMLKAAGTKAGEDENIYT